LYQWKKVRPALATAAIITLPALAACGEFEDPPAIDAEDMAGGIPLKGEHYTIADSVPTDGFMAEFTIVSPFGTFTASGPGMLATRVNEIRALAALEHIERDEQFQKGATEAAKETASNLERLVTNPGDTIKGIPEGVGRFFERTYRSAKTGLQKVDDVRHGGAPGIAEDAPPSQLPGAPRTPAAAPTESLSKVAARAAGNTALNTLGFDDDRRRLAKELAVDPYTTNPVLSAKLDEVTWAAFAGNLGVDLLTSMIPGGMIVSTSSRLTDWVWDTPPGDLRLEIEATLRSIGVGQEEIDRFLRHRWYPLSLQAALAASLAALDGVEGRAEVIPLALGVGSEGQARFVVQTLAMLARYHKTVEPLATLVADGTVYGETGNGALAVMAPVDYLSWTPIAKTFAERKSELGSERTLYIAGRATRRARDALEDLGWKVEERSPLLVPLLAPGADAK
jgi:hypothetical protein